MPELPEVETTRRGLEPHLIQQTIKQIIIRKSHLRWPIPKEIQLAEKQIITKIWRRGKYLIIAVPTGNLLLHLGMSGCLRILPAETPVNKHDHVDIVLQNATCIRFTDPRRFGALLWLEQDPLQHKLLKNLGPEPLTEDFTAEYLFQKTRTKKRAIKEVIMDSQIVVGVGNIYAAEALFIAGIHPLRPANEITLINYKKLHLAIKEILAYAVKRGGTTIRDFLSSDGKPGYFKQELKVYGRQGDPCVKCAKPLKQIRQQNRATVFCSTCQK